MSRTFDDKWRDFSGRYGTRTCPFCKGQKLDFSEPRRATIGESDVVAVACLECGHIEFFDVATVEMAADEVDKDYREKGWR